MLARNGATHLTPNLTPSAPFREPESEAPVKEQAVVRGVHLADGHEGVGTRIVLVQEKGLHGFGGEERLLDALPRHELPVSSGVSTQGVA